MERRSFLKHSGMAGILAAGSAPAFAQASPTIKWRCASSFPKSLDTIYGAAETARRPSATSPGQVPDPGVRLRRDRARPAGRRRGAERHRRVRPHGALLLRRQGSDVRVRHGDPFGLNQRQYDAWWYFGGGEQLFNEFLKEYGITSILCGNTGAQMGGWYRKEIKTVDDLKGLKMRIGGFAGQVLAKLGVVPQQIAGGEIYPALEKGTIDAAEWVGPYDDEKLGFNKVAKFYYYPGWWEGGPALHLFSNTAKYNELPAEYKAALLAGCHEGNTWMMAKYDAQNPARCAPGRRRRAAAPVPKAVMDACYKSAMELYAETSAKNPNFKKVSTRTWRSSDDQILWFRVTENTYDNYMATAAQARRRRVGPAAAAIRPRAGRSSPRALLRGFWGAPGASPRPAPALLLQRPRSPSRPRLLVQQVLQRIARLAGRS